MTVQQQLNYLNSLNPGQYEPKQADVLNEIQFISSSFSVDEISTDPELVGMIEQAYTKFNQSASRTRSGKSTRQARVKSEAKKYRMATKPRKKKVKTASAPVAPAAPKPVLKKKATASKPKATKAVASKVVKKKATAKPTRKVGDLNTKQEAKLKKEVKRYKNVAESSTKKLTVLNEILKQDTKKLETIHRISNPKAASVTGKTYTAKKVKGKKSTADQKTKILAQRVRSQSANAKRRKKTGTQKPKTQYVSLLSKIFG